VTAEDLFTRLTPLVMPAIEYGFRRRDLCVLAAHAVIDVAEYFGIMAQPLPVKTVLLNAAFAAHVKRGEIDVRGTVYQLSGFDIFCEHTLASI